MLEVTLRHATHLTVDEAASTSKAATAQNLAIFESGIRLEHENNELVM